MPKYDFEKPVTFLNALEQYALAHQAAMTALRDEVNFGEGREQTILNAANLFCSMLEDSHPEALALMNTLERRVLGTRGN